MQQAVERIQRYFDTKSKLKTAATTNQALSVAEARLSRILVDDTGLFLRVWGTAFKTADSMWDDSVGEAILAAALATYVEKKYPSTYAFRRVLEVEELFKLGCIHDACVALRCNAYTHGILTPSMYQIVNDRYIGLSFDDEASSGEVYDTVEEAWCRPPELLLHSFAVSFTSLVANIIE